MPSLFLTHDFHLSLSWFSRNPCLISHHATSSSSFFFFFFSWLFSLNPSSSSLYGRTQKPKLESWFRSSWVGVLKESFLSRRGWCSWLGLRSERLGYWGGGRRRGWGGFWLQFCGGFKSGWVWFNFGSWFGFGIVFYFYSAKGEGERKVKPPPWKKMMMGREVVSVSVGMKRRN